MRPSGSSLNLIVRACLALAGSCWAIPPAAASQITVVIEKFELEATDAVRLLNPLGKPPSSAEIHAAALDLVDSGDAEVVDTQVLRLRSGMRAETESIREFLYLKTEDYRSRRLPLWWPGTVVEVRNLGDSLEVDFVYHQPHGIVQLGLDLETDSLAGFSHSARIRFEGWIYSTGVFPIFSLQQTITQIRAAVGEVTLVSIQSATDESGEPDPKRKHVVFARVIPR